MRKSSVDKMTKIHKTIEGNLWLRCLSRLHTITVYLVLFVVVLTGCMYARERIVAPSILANIETVVSSKEEFEDGEPVQFYLVGSLNSNRTIKLETRLICDSGSSEGVSIIGRDITELLPGHMTQQYKLDIVREYSKEISTGTVFSKQARSIRNVVNGAAMPITVFSKPSRSTPVSRCRGEHNVFAATPIFNIPVTKEMSSFPFKYIWYDNYNTMDEYD